MTKAHNQLSDKQREILRREQLDTAATDHWVNQQGIRAEFLGTTPIALVKAHQAAHQALKHNHLLLTPQQAQLLKGFCEHMTHKRTRAAMCAADAYPILSLTRKLQRQRFKQHRQSKANTADSPLR